MPFLFISFRSFKRICAKCCHANVYVGDFGKFPTFPIDMGEKQQIIQGDHKLLLVRLEFMQKRFSKAFAGNV